MLPLQPPVLPPKKDSLLKRIFFTNIRIPDTGAPWDIQAYALFKTLRLFPGDFSATDLLILACSLSIFARYISLPFLVAGIMFILVGALAQRTRAEVFISMIRSSYVYIHLCIGLFMLPLAFESSYGIAFRLVAAVQVFASVAMLLFLSASKMNINRYYFNPLLPVKAVEYLYGIFVISCMFAAIYLLHWPWQTALTLALFAWNIANGFARSSAPAALPAE